MPHFDFTRSCQTMKLDREGNVAILTLSRPDAMNAMNSQFFADFQNILQNIENNLSGDDHPVRALLILAEGKGFCAGADLKDQSGEMPPQLGDVLRKNYIPLITNLKKLPIPTIAAVNGAVAGAGMSLVCACDIAIAEQQAYFLQAFVNIALVPDAGSTYFLPRLAGRARAAAMMMLGERISAGQALEYGIISSITTPEQLVPEAMALAKRLAHMPTKTLLEIRKLLDASEQNSLAEQMEAEAEAQQRAGQSEDFIEGVSAFLQKRPPAFKGR